MKKSILIVYESMVIGGSTTALLSLLNALDENEYDVELILYKEKGELFDLIPPKVNVLPMAYIRHGKVWKLFRLFFSKYLFLFLFGAIRYKRVALNNAAVIDFQVNALSRKIKKHYDLCIGYIEGWADRFVANNVVAEKKLCWLHSSVKNLFRFYEFEHAWMEKVDNIVLVADKVKEDFDAAFPKFKSKSIMLQNLMDSNVVKKRVIELDENAYREYKNAKKVKLCTVCRIRIDIKGLDRIVACASKLKNDGYDFLFYIIGGGNELPILQKIIIDSGVDDCVKAIGSNPNPYPYIALSDFYVNASRFEGKPITVTESMILGIPPIVTKYLSANEQIQNGVDGLVVDNNDDAIYYGIKKVLDDSKLASDMRTYLREHDYGNMNYYKVIKEYLG